MHMHNRREFLLAGAAAATAGVLGLPRAALAQEKTLPLLSYGGRWETFFRETLGPQFAALGYEPIIEVGNGGKWAADMRTAARESPPYSYIMTNEIVGSILRAEGYFEPWNPADVPNMAELHPKALVADGAAVTAMFAPIGIAYRTDMVSTPPKSWRDLWENKELRGQLGLFSLQNTAGYMFLLMTAQTFGSGPFDFDTAFAKIEELGSFLQADMGGGLTVYLSRGEVGVAVQDMAETMNLRRKGVPVAFAIPEEGMFAFDQTFSKVANGPSPKAAADFLNLMLSEPIQKILAQDFLYLPARKGIELPQDLAELGLSTAALDNLVSFDWVEASKHRAEVTERWNKLAR